MLNVKNNELIKNDFNISVRSSLGQTCAICLSDILDGELISTLPCNLKHCFHTYCLENWFEKNSSCPICRAKFNSILSGVNNLNINNQNNNAVELQEGFL
jgi:E3 ubiquitin-protein ligase ATL6/9/15/31/42/55